MLSASSSSSSSTLVHKQSKKPTTIYEVFKDPKKMKLYLPDGGRISERLTTIALPIEEIENHKFDYFKHCKEVPYLIEQRLDRLYRIDFSFIGAIIDYPSWLFQYHYLKEEYESNIDYFNKIVGKMCDMRIDVDIITRKAYRDNIIKRFIEHNYSFNFLSVDGKTSILEDIVNDEMVVFFSEELFRNAQQTIVGFTFGLIERAGPDVMNRVVSLRFIDVIPHEPTLKWLMDYIKTSNGSVKELIINNDERQVAANLDFILHEIYNLNHDLYSLDLSNCDLSFENFNQLGRFLRENGRLYKIKIARTQLTINHINAFKEAFFGNHVIENKYLANVVFKNTWINPDMLFILSSCFEHMINLKQLSLSHNIIVGADPTDDHGLIELFKCLTKSRVISLDLSNGVYIGSRTISRFFVLISEWLKNNLTIKSLKLKRNFIEEFAEDDAGGDDQFDLPDDSEEIFNDFVENLIKYDTKGKCKLEKLNMRKNGIMTESMPSLGFDELIKNERIRKLYLDGVGNNNTQNIKNKKLNFNMVVNLLKYNYNMTRLDLNDLTPIEGIPITEYHIVKEREKDTRQISIYLLKEFCIQRNFRLSQPIGKRLLQSLQAELGILIPEDIAYSKRVGGSPYVYHFKDLPFTNDILTHIIDDIPDYLTPFYLQLSNAQDHEVSMNTAKDIHWTKKLADKLSVKGLNLYLKSFALDFFTFGTYTNIKELLESLLFKIENPLLSGLPFLTDKNDDLGNDVLESFYLRDNMFVPTIAIYALIGEIVARSRIKTFLFGFSYHINFLSDSEVDGVVTRLMRMMHFVHQSSHLTTFGISFKNFLSKVDENVAIRHHFRLWFFNQLSKCKTVKTVIFDDTFFGHYKFIEEEFKFILKMPNLTEFKLSKVVLYGNQFEPLIQLIASSRLESFHLSLRDFMSNDINLVANDIVLLFKQNKTLVNIDIPQFTPHNQERLRKIVERNKALKLQTVSLDDDYNEMAGPMPKRSSGGKKHHISTVCGNDEDYITKVTYYIDLLIYNEQFVRNDVQKQKLRKIYHLLLSELYVFSKSSRMKDDYNIFVEHTSYIIKHQFAKYRSKYTLFHK